MTIHFYLRFYSHFGQTLYITGNSENLGSGDPQHALALTYQNENFWHVAIEVAPQYKALIQYSYILKNADGTLVMEWGNDRVLDPSKMNAEQMQVIDTWNHAGEFENVFYSAPFRQTLLTHHHGAPKSKSAKSFTHIFKVKAPLLKKNEILCLAGSAIELGEWKEVAAVPMTLEGDWWTASVRLPKEELPLNYKYGVYNTREKKFNRFENENNRVVYGDAAINKITILHDGFVHLPNNTWRGAGVAIPVFSLRSKDSFGVGEFADIKLLVDWAKKTGMKLVQILPVNDTTATHTWLDSYPYGAISAFALHPIYLNLEKLIGKKYASIFKPLRKKQKLLNEAVDLDYEEVMKIKLPVIRELFALEKEAFLQDEDFRKFYLQNRHWLVPYAAFCHLRDRNGTVDFTKWDTHSRYDKQAIDKYVAPRNKHYDEIALHYFTQYHLHLQLREAADYAHANGIIMKGDLPIGIYRHSCDAWVEPGLYHMEMQAGAPPDDFAIKGQNWGFPTYNWEKMEKDGFAWWKKRFRQMANYFDAFRIDHILGFFRIWSIPMHEVQGLMGHFDPALTVSATEFEQTGISFDYHRYTNPFINDAVLWEFFGADSDFVKEHFLAPLGDGFFELKAGGATQRAIENHFDNLEKNDFNDRIKNGLFDLVSNVILLEPETPGENRFHFRIAVEQTASFRYLDWWVQQKIRELYVNYFYRRQDHFWQEEAMKKLPALKRATNMLVCGEDLGMVPHCVPDTMSQLGILSLEIQRMPKDSNKQFFYPADAPYLSVITPSTHDMSTIRGWWEEDRSKTQQFFNQELGQWGDAPYYCEPWINKAIVLQHLHSPAMWSIFQLQDLLGMSGSIRRENPHDERINVPANSQHYWKYRMHISLETLIREKEFNEELKNYVQAADR